MNFKKQIEDLKNMALDFVNKESPKEDIEKVNKFNEGLDALSKEHEGKMTELADMKDAYIKAMKTTGSSEEPKDDLEPQKPKTFEDIAKEIIQNRKK